MDTEIRLQQINDDAVIEVTETVTKTTRYSEKDLLRQKETLESSIAKFQGHLDEVNIRLSQIENEKGKL